MKELEIADYNVISGGNLDFMNTISDYCSALIKLNRENSAHMHGGSTDIMLGIFNLAEGVESFRRGDFAQAKTKLTASFDRFILAFDRWDSVLAHREANW